MDVLAVVGEVAESAFSPLAFLDRADERVNREERACWLGHGQLEGVDELCVKCVLGADSVSRV